MGTSHLGRKKPTASIKALLGFYFHKEKECIGISTQYFEKRVYP
jgi:hypothetical protein